MTDTLTPSSIDRIVDLAQQAQTIQKFERDGRMFADRHVHRVHTDRKVPAPLEFFTLQAFAEFLAAEPEAKGCLVHVVNATQVQAVGVLEGEDHDIRPILARAIAKVEPVGFRPNQYMPLEALNIALQTCFDPSQGDIVNLRKFCADVRSTEELGVADDGVSQAVQAKSGIAAVQRRAVQNPWELAPWFSFAEIEQPCRPFILRFQKGEGPMAGLFETGNNRSTVEAVSRIASFLRSEIDSELDCKVLG